MGVAPYKEQPCKAAFFMLKIKTKLYRFGYPIVIRTNIILVKQEFAIIPSTFDASQLGVSTLNITDEETKELFVYGPVSDLVWDTAPFDWDDEARDWDFDQITAEEGWFFEPSEDGNFLIITLLSTVGLREGARYSLEIKNNSTVIYRDTMFVSNRGGATEVYSYPNNYVSMNQSSNGYTVI